MSKLISCPDCGHQVSKKARNCPKCGRTINSAINSFIWQFFGVLFLLGVIFSMLSSYQAVSQNDELGNKLDAILENQK